MSEFCLSNSSSSKTQFSSLLLSDFMLFCSFILSHPLYFSYFIFFSPYLLKLFSFLSPLFITTSLLLLSLLTGFPGLLHSPPQLPHQSSKVSFLLTTYNTVLQRLHTKIEDENQGFHHDQFEELEAYRIVFETCSSMLEVGDSPVEDFGICGSEAAGEALTSNLEENSWPEVTQPVAGVKTLEGFFKEVEEEPAKVEEKEVKEVKAIGTKPNKVEEPLMRTGSKAMGSKIREMVAKFSDDNSAELITSKVIKNSRKMGTNPDSIDNGGEYTSKVTQNSRVLVTNLDSDDKGRDRYTSKVTQNSQNLGPNLNGADNISKVPVENSNSADNGGEDTSKAAENSKNWVANLDSDTLKAKESSRKLDSDDNGEEYNSKVVPNLGSFGSMRKEKEWKRTLACKLFEERHNVEGAEGMDMLWETYEADSNKGQGKNKTTKGKKGGIEYYEDGEDEEDEEEVDAQLCCLQALKFSTGKMNLGMGRPNLLRISKALKGIGWLHHVTRHGKKGYN